MKIAIQHDRYNKSSFAAGHRVPHQKDCVPAILNSASASEDKKLLNKLNNN